MVKRTRRKNKSKKRTNRKRTTRKRTTRKRTTRRLRGGQVTIPNNIKELLSKYNNRVHCLQWCSNCGQGQLPGLKKGLCYDAAESKTKGTDCYKCDCGFKLNNRIAKHIITSNYDTINGEYDENVKIKSDKLNSLKQIYREKMAEFNNVCNKTYTVFEIDKLTTTDKSGVQHNPIFDNIRDLAIKIDLNMGVGSVHSLEAPKKLLKWLPLKESDFYNSTFTGLVKAITG
jgi:hypothetical protein